MLKGATLNAEEMKQEFLKQVVDLLRETFEGGLPGQGTQYLDHSSGIRSTLNSVTAEQASKRLDGHPSIASHARHMNFHLRVTSEWILGDHSKRDWIGSFEPQTVTEEEWARVKQDLEASRRELIKVIESLPGSGSPRRERRWGRSLTWRITSGPSGS